MDKIKSIIFKQNETTYYNILLFGQTNHRYKNNSRREYLLSYLCEGLTHIVLFSSAQLPFR
jgi:hypothetical protein